MQVDGLGVPPSREDIFRLVRPGYEIGTIGWAQLSQRASTCQLDCHSRQAMEAVDAVIRVEGKEGRAATLT